jgi:uncharacterized protein (TIGR02996 family)
VLREPALEAAIVASPEDRAAYEVYADWLAERDDPRGEWIHVQLALELRPADAALVVRSAELLRAHEADWTEGVTSPSTRDPRMTWRRGFIDHVEISGAYQSNDSTLVWTEVARLATAIVMRSATIGALITHHGSGPDDHTLFEAMRDHPPPPALRELILSCGTNDISWTQFGDISIANAALANLEVLTIAAGRITLGTIDLPKLRKLHITCGGLPGHVLASIAAARWPALEELDVFTGTQEYSGTCTEDGVRALLRANLPAVRGLGIENCEFGDALAGLVARAPIVKQLRRLDLSRGTMGDDGARAILEHAKRFAHLDVLDLTENYLSAAIAREVTNALPRALIGDQKTEDPYGRFVSVSE